MIDGCAVTASGVKGDADWEFVKGQIEAYNLRAHPALFDPSQPQPNVNVYLRDAAGVIVGGALAEVEWEAIHIFFLWVAEPLRGRGAGSELLRRIETEGQSVGAKWASVSTYSFQAPDFYRKHGYRVVGVLDGLPPGHAWYLMRKDFQ